jgi:hypothetical protein
MSTLCDVCAHVVPLSATAEWQTLQFPYSSLVKPKHRNSNHQLRYGMLLASPAMFKVIVCSNCLHYLHANLTPPLSLANDLWIGRVPFVLSKLTITERLAISRTSSTRHIVHLVPAANSTYTVTTWHTQLLDPIHEHDIMKAQASLPRTPSMVANMITLLTTESTPQFRHVPNIFKIRNRFVNDALLCLKSCNRSYRDIHISESKLARLPDDDVPPELMLTTTANFNLENETGKSSLTNNY